MFIAYTATVLDTVSAEERVEKIVQKANDEQLKIISLAMTNQGNNIIIAAVLKR